jgi:hypothetical protein
MPSDVIAQYSFIFGWKRFLKNQELSHLEFWKRDTAQVRRNGLHDEVTTTTALKIQKGLNQSARR